MENDVVELCKVMEIDTPKPKKVWHTPKPNEKGRAMIMHFMDANERKHFLTKRPALKGKILGNYLTLNQLAQM